MDVRSFIVAIIISTFMSGNAAAQEIPNPVQVIYGFKAPAQSYAVDCWSAPGVHGTWLLVASSTYMTQDALIYTQPPRRPGTFRDSILYCFAADGRPGVISGAPPGIMLPPGSRVEIHTVGFVMLTHFSGGKAYDIGIQVLLDAGTRVAAGPTGIVVKPNPREISVYPAGATLTIGDGQAVSYFRPGQTVPQIRPPPEATGCAVTYINDRGEVARTMRYSQSCSDVQLDSLLKVEGSLVRR